MNHLKGSIITATGMAMLAVLGVACTLASPTPTEPNLPAITVSNLRIPTPPPSPTPSPSPTPGQLPGDAPRGQAIFALQQCAACHGQGGAGGFAPALNTADFRQKFAQDAVLWTLLRQGSGAMPAYGVNRLTDQEMADLIAYVRSLP